MLRIFTNHTENNAIELVTKLNVETKTSKTFIRCLDAIKLELI